MNQLLNDDFCNKLHKNGMSLLSNKISWASHHQREEVIQDSMCVLTECIQSGKFTSKSEKETLFKELNAYFLRIVQNKVYEFIRQQGRENKRIEKDVDVDRMADQSALHAQEVDMQERGEVVIGLFADMLKNLPAQKCPLHGNVRVPAPIVREIFEDAVENRAILFNKKTRKVCAGDNFSRWVREYLKAKLTDYLGVSDFSTNDAYRIRWNEFFNTLIADEFRNRLHEDGLNTSDLVTQ